MAESNTSETKKVIDAILSTIDKEREREIISRRFGLFDRKETLEQIGELLGITRERVRQLEKAIITRLKAQSSSDSILPELKKAQQLICNHLEQNGNAARISTLTNAIWQTSDKVEQSRLAFITLLSPELVTVDENDYFYQSCGLVSVYKTSKDLSKSVDEIVSAIKEIGKPIKVAQLSKSTGQHELTVSALASISKQLSTLNGDWGLSKWPTVNPKNIRDKIFVILKENGKQMHFSEIAKEIKKSDFKRKDVTTQAIHNELIKDNRFVLVGRGIYALKEWGYKKGTVADVIAEILKKANEPLHRDEIVKRVLKNRYVKETTILLNLQGKPQFKRVAKATYSLSEE